jgi:dihydroneopterin aldolase
VVKVHVGLRRWGEKARKRLRHDVYVRVPEDNASQNDENAIW